jgi:RNA polymerase sigma-70 factor (ECF subfamily)
MLLKHDPTDSALFDSIMQGDEKSFRKFYERYFPFIYNQVLRIIRTEAEAEEVTQEVFVTVWMKRDLVFTKQNFKPYLCTLAQNKAIDFLRQLKREKKLYHYIQETAGEDQFEMINAKADDSDYLPLLHQAIEKLPKKRKMVFCLCKLENKSYREINVRLQLSKHTINDHIVKANRFVRQYLSCVTQNAEL